MNPPSPEECNRRILIPSGMTLTTRRCGCRFTLTAPLLLGLFLFIAPSDVGRAQQVGDVMVRAQAMYSGNTYHGYAETRISLENRSANSHRVALTYPNRPWGHYGNGLGEISRTVVLPPEARAVVPLWQPPLPANGDGNLRVMVDDTEGWVNSPNGNKHMGRSYGTGAGRTPAVLFVARGLDHEQVMRALGSEHDAFTAAMATGPPDAGRTPGFGRAWQPDGRVYGTTNWLELEYSPPIQAERIRIYQADPSMSVPQVVVTGPSGTNSVHVTAPPTTSRAGRRSMVALTLPALPEPVEKIRLEFGTAPPRAIGVDAVELVGPRGRAWATTARASSDNSAMAASGMAGPARAETIACIRADLPVAEWSESWLAYTPFDVVVLTAQELDALPAGVASALWRYVQAGGNLFVFGATTIPAIWQSSALKDNRELTEFSVGLGRCVVSSEKDINSLTAEAMKILQSFARNAALYWHTLPSDDDSANRMFPVVSDVKIPVRGMAIIMLGFVILIGPANLILLSRRNRRTWMLWTIPALSLATTLLVFVYSLLREGVTPDSRVRSLTLIEQATHSAVTVGVAAFYCPLTPNRGLSFHYETEVTPLVSLGYHRSGGTMRQLDWTQTQHLGRGWISARVPAHFHVRKAETRRERLQLERAGDDWEVINGLGGTVASLWLADWQGKVFQANNISAGQKARLTPAGGMNPAAEKTGIRALWREAGFTAKLPREPGKYLQPGSYIAEMTENPFVEAALGKAGKPERNRSSAMVFGILEAPEKK